MHDDGKTRSRQHQVALLNDFPILTIAYDNTWLDPKSFIYLKLAVAGHLTLFVARNQCPFFFRPYPAPVLLAAIVSTQLAAALIVDLGLLMAPLPWSYAGLVWAYCLIWIFIEDWLKLHIYQHLSMTGKGHRDFLSRCRQNLHPHGTG